MGPSIRSLARVALMILAGGCGGATQSAPRAVAPAPPAPEEELAAPSPRSDGTIPRAELMPVLDAGLGYFLRGVRVEPSLVDGAFEGYRLTHLYPDDPRFQAIDLRPGAVVLRVNRRPIERPEQAQQVWDELRVASQLLVEYRRDGEDRELRLAIVD